MFEKEEDEEEEQQSTSKKAKMPDHDKDEPGTIPTNGNKGNKAIFLRKVDYQFLNCGLSIGGCYIGWSSWMLWCQRKKKVYY